MIYLIVNKYILVSIGFLLFASTQFSIANDLNINQSGQGGDIIISVEHPGANSKLNANQSGIQNLLDASIGTNASLSVVQQGNFGKIKLNDQQAKSSSYNINQFGVHNTLTGTYTGHSNWTDIQQDGDNNTLTVSVDGNSNALDLTQGGDRNRIDIDLNSSSGNYGIRQYGSSNNLEIEMYSSGVNLNITQSGNGDSVTIKQ